MRSSCEAVATKERRAASWRRSSRCIVASARARSPTSSRPSSRGVGASVPSSATRTAAARSRARRRPMSVARTMPSRMATASPTAAAARNALRTCPTAVSTSLSCFCVTRTKSPEVGRLAGAHRVEPDAVGTLSGCTTMTWLSRRTVRASGCPMTLRISLRGIALPAKSVSAIGLLAGHRRGDDDPRVRALAQDRGAVRDVEAQLQARSSGVSRALSDAPQAGGDVALEERHVGGGGVLEVAGRLVGQALLQRRKQRQRRHRERDHAGEDQRGQQPRAQAEGPAPGHCSRKR